MVHFLDLPLELLPIILSHLLKSHHLALACRVNKSFLAFAIPKLYERVSFYSWQREGKARVVHLFITLSKSPHLAKHVRRLEIREFPKAFYSTEVEILSIVLQGLRNCINLQACTWTRDGSLNSDILNALQTCGSLQELEINGHNDGNYDPTILQRFVHLSRISLIMPSGPVASQLLPWMNLTGGTLRSLTFICKLSPIITDDLLESLAPNLVNLDQFFITGCIKVTHRGVWAVLSNNITGILGLGLEGVSSKFDMNEFGQLCNRSGTLARLRSITLTVHQQLPLDIWMNNVLNLLSFAPLEIFQIYSTGAFFESPTTNYFWSKLIFTHGKRLKRFSVHRMLISMDAISEICFHCTSLEQLFIVVERDSMEVIGRCLSHATALRTIHINYPHEAHTDSPPILLPANALNIIQQCSSTLTQFGCNARVWQVGRSIEKHEDGTIQMTPKLLPYESPDIPEQFLVVRT